MIKKLFGETEEEQFMYLRTRVFALGAGVVTLLIGGILAQIGLELGEIIGTVGTAICVIVILMFGWAVMRGLFGFASLGALFSQNPVMIVVIFVLFITIGYLGGFLVAFIGVCRFFMLLKKRKDCNQ